MTRVRWPVPMPALVSGDTFASLFSGFGGADIGAQASGLELAWGIELDPAIAAVANRNLGGHVTVANILDCDPRDFAPVDVLHASPPCPSFSVASQGSETELDIALARKVAEFITVLQPRIFTLENVWAYRNSQSWRIVEDALHAAGYWVHVDHVNAADMGVPQTRKRMIVRAIRGGFVPYLPEPMPWVGWYAAVEDLLSTLPESQFAPWQLARLPELLQTVLIPQGGDRNYDLPAHTKERPAFTITANPNQIGIRAFLVGDQERPDADADDPAFTVRAGEHGGAPPRAFLMPGAGNTNFAEAHPGKGCRYEHEPSHTVPAISSDGGAMPKAWLVSGQNASANNGIPTVRDSESPAPTITNQAKGYSRALLAQGRIVAMTPRCLARFQSFPDTYDLPGNARLAAKGIGNALPPLLYQRIIAPLLEAL